MNVKSYVRAFALTATLLFLSMSAAPVITATLLTGDERTARLAEALDALRRDPAAPGAASDALRALDELPPDLRSSPALRQLEAVLRALENPLFARLMAPLLRQDFREDPQAYAAYADRQALAFEAVQASLGLDAAALGPEHDALRALTRDLDLTDAATFQASLATRPDSDVRDLQDALAAFARRWSETSGTDLAGDMDAAAAALAREDPRAVRTGAVPAAELRAGSAALLKTLQELEASYATTASSADLSPGDRAAVEALRDQVRHETRALMANLRQDAFAGIPETLRYPYNLAPAPQHLATGAQPHAPPVDVWRGPATQTGPVATPEVTAPAPLLHPALVATSLGLPGAHGVPSRATSGTGALTGSLAVEIFPLQEDRYASLLSDPNETSHRYTLTLPANHYVRLFLEYNGGNADLELLCQETGRTWTSRSDGTSLRPWFDSITFVNNAPGVAEEEAFVPLGAAACPGSRFNLTVSAAPGSPGPVSYLLRGDGQPYSEALCGEADPACGLNWARWRDRCESANNTAERVCRREEGGAPGNHQPWSALQGGRENPVLFVHGVGGPGTAWMAPQAVGFYKMACLVCVEAIKDAVKGAVYITLSIAAVWVLMEVTKMSAMAAASASIVGALYGLLMVTDTLMDWADFVTSVVKISFDLLKNWRRGDTLDTKGFFWEAKAAGFETYLFEYNFNDNNARPGQIQMAANQLKFAVSAIQQEFYDRHSREAGFPLRAPEDVRVDIVAHSMGGLVSRTYTTGTEWVQEGSYSAPLYEGDINKLIMIQTPNGGSTIAALSLTGWVKPIPDLMTELLKQWFFRWAGGRLGAGDMAPGFTDFAWAVMGFVLKEAIAIFALHSLEGRTELIRGNTQSWVTTLNARPVAPDVDHGLMWGDAFDGDFVGIGYFDYLVAKEDVLEPPHLASASGVARIHNDHGSALWGERSRAVMLAWLSNPDGATLPSPPDPPSINSSSASASPAAAGAGSGASTSSHSFSTQAAGTSTGHSLLRDFGQDLGGAARDPGARYTPDSGPLTGPAPYPRAPTSAQGDRTARLERLAVEKGLQDATTFGSLGGFARHASADLNGANETEYNATVDRQLEAAQALYRQSMRSPSGLARAEALAADIGILRSGHSEDAAKLLDGLGEPYVFIDPLAFPSEFAKRRIVLVPTGALAGMRQDSALAATLDGYARNGGTLLVLAQQRGEDLRLVPGALEGFGFVEEEASYRGSAVFGTFTPVLAGQTQTFPDLHADGSFTQVPADATVLLRHAKNARPLLVSYDWGAGSVVAGQLLADWARASGRATPADLAIVRDVIATTRAPAALAAGAPGASLTLTVPLGALAEGTANVTLVLVDGGARDIHRVTLPAAASLTWTVPANVTKGGFLAVDAILLAANGSATGRIHGLLEAYTAAYAANPSGFRPLLAPAVLDVTSATDRTELGHPFAFDLRVTNLESEARTYTVRYWYPEHARTTGDPAFGGGPAQNGAPAAWEDNFRLGATVTVGAGETVVLPASLATVTRSDAVAARLYGEDGTLLGEASRSFAAYRASLTLVATPAQAVAAAGDEVGLRVDARVTGATSSAEAFPVTVRATVRDASGATLHVATGTLVVSAQQASLNLTVPVPADAAPGTYTVAVEALRATERVGATGTAFRVPPVQVATAATLPAAFTRGTPSPVVYTFRNTGVEPVANATVTLALVSPSGVTEWTGTGTFSLAPGESLQEAWNVTPASAAFGTYRLTHVVRIGDVAFEGETPIVAGVSGHLAFDRVAYRARDTLQAEARLVNDGRFVLPLDVTLGNTLGLAPVTAALSLAPGESARIPLAGTVPADVAAGRHTVTATLATPDGTKSLERGFSIAPARVTLSAPAPGTNATAGGALEASLRNTGGVDATVPWAVELSDAAGRVVARATGATLAVAGATVALPVPVPAQAATGSYVLLVTAEVLPGRPTTLQRTLHVDGVAGTVTLAAPTTVEAGATVPLSATATSTGVPHLEGALTEFTAYRPAPLAAWVPLAGVPGATSAVEYAGARWFATPTGLVRVAPDGATTRLGTADGLPGQNVRALAVAGGLLYAGTDRGLAWTSGGAWSSTATLGNLPTAAVTALAGTPDALYVGTLAGVVRLRDGAFTPVALPAGAALSLAADALDLWVALAEVRDGFTGDDFTPVTRKEATRASPAVAFSPLGDVHLVYVDTENGAQALRHAHLSAAGALLGPVTTVASGPGARSNPSVAVDRAGGVHVAWADTRNGDSDVYYRRLGTDGQPATAEIPVGAHTGTQQRFPDIALDAEDRPALVWTDDREPNPPGTFGRADEVYYAKLDRQGAALVPATRLTHSERYVLRPDLSLDASGAVHVSWTDQVERCDIEFPTICWHNLEAFYGRWTAEGARIVAPAAVSPVDDFMSWVPTLAVTPSGDAHLVYQESTEQGLRLAYSRVTAGGLVSVRGAILTPEGQPARNPQALARGDNQVEVVWTDYRSGREQLYRNVLTPANRAFAGADTMVNAPATVTNASGIFGLRIAISTTGALAAAWDETRNGTSQLRMGLTKNDIQGRGAVRLELATGAVTRLTVANGLLPSDDVTAVALDRDVAAVATGRAVTFRERATGEVHTVTVAAPLAPAMALHKGKAYRADADGVITLDPVTETVARLQSGGPLQVSGLASVSAGVLVLGATATALHRDDREDRLWTLTAPTPGSGEATPASFPAPAEAGRVVVRARLLSATGQPLAETERDVHVVTGDLALTIKPSTSVARPGELVAVQVEVVNRGPRDLRGVAVALRAGSETLLDVSVALPAGATRAFTVHVARHAGFDLVATAEGSPVNAGGALATLAAQVRDHVRVEAPAVAARLLAPSVAGLDAFPVDTLVANSGRFPARVTLTLDGGHAPREIEVPARSRLLVTALAHVTVRADTTLRLVVSGDAALVATRAVAAGERALLRDAAPLAGAAGERTLTLSFEGAGPLATTFPLTLALDGVALPAVTLQVAPGTRADHDLPLTLAPGLHTLTYETPWEKGSVRLAAGDAAIPVLRLGAVGIAGGNATAPVWVENAGPGRLLATLVVDFGQGTTVLPVDLAEGATLAATAAHRLAGMPPGPATVRAHVARDGAPLAEAEATYEVPGPSLHIVQAPADGAVRAGDALTLTYVVENRGDATGAATLRVVVGSASAETRTVTLAPGEKATLTFEARVDADAPDGTLPVTATTRVDRATATYAVTGARVAASAAWDTPTHAAGSLAPLSVTVTNPGDRALDLVARATLGARSAQERVTLAAGATTVVTLLVPVSESGDARWSLALESGRVLEEGALRVVVDRFAADGVRVLTDAQTYPAGGLVNVTVTTATQGRVDLLGPGFRDTFVLNGTTTRQYRVPAEVVTGRYTLYWNFDATNASGGVPVGVRGVEVRSLALDTGSAGTLTEGDLLPVTWTVRSSVPVSASVRTWFEDAQGETRGAVTGFVTLAAGDNVLSLPRLVPGLEPGTVRFVATLDLDVAPAPVLLARDSAALALRGTALREAVTTPSASGDGFTLDLRFASTEGAPVRLLVEVAGTLVHDVTLQVDGPTAHELVVPVLEPGTYPVTLVLETPEGRVVRRLQAGIPGAGTAPTTRVAIEGASLVRPDGVLALAGDARLRFTATDAGSGVAMLLVTDNGSPIPADEAGTLAPGWHTLRFAAVDRAGHREEEQRLVVFLDGAAPVLTLTDPTPGSVHVAGVPAATPPPTSIPVAVLPAPETLTAPFAEVLDSDGDGHTDAEELAEGTDPWNPHRAPPARWAPGAPPAFERPLLVVGALRLAFTATDEGTGAATWRLLLDGAPLLAGADGYAGVIDLSRETPGDHLLTLLVEDALGNVAQRDIRLFLIPTDTEGLLALDPADPRLPPWVGATVAWAKGALVAAPDALLEDEAAHQRRQEERAAALYAGMVEPLIPPAVSGLPGHLERQAEHVKRALEESGILA